MHETLIQVIDQGENVGNKNLLYAHWEHIKNLWRGDTWMIQVLALCQKFSSVMWQVWCAIHVCFSVITQSQGHRQRSAPFPMLVLTDQQCLTAASAQRSAPLHLLLPKPLQGTVPHISHEMLASIIQNFRVLKQSISSEQLAVFVDPYGAVRVFLSPTPIPPGSQHYCLTFGFDKERPDIRHPIFLGHSPRSTAIKR